MTNQHGELFSVSDTMTGLTAVR